MRCRALIAPAAHLFFAAIALGAEEAGREAAPAAFANAHEVYAERYSHSPPGVHEDGEVVFVIAEIKTEGVPRDRQQALAVFAMWDELRDYIARRRQPREAPALPALLGVFPDLLPVLRAENSDIGRFPMKYDGQTRVLANTAKDGIYRHAVALPYADLTDFLSPDPLAMRTFQKEDESRVLTAWRNAWARCAGKDEWSVLSGIIPLPEDELRLAGEEMSRRLNMDSLCWGVLSPGAMHAAFIRASTLGESPSLEDMAAAAAGLPVPAGVMLAWAETPEASPWDALGVRLLALADESACDAAINNLSKRLNGLFGDYALWMSALAARPWPNLFGDNTPGPSALAAWRTLGHANFPENAPIAETSEYREAKRLFDAGRDLPRIAGLILQSVESSPCHAPSWALLGDALLASGAPEDAIWPLAQALRLSPRNADTRTSLALAYQEAGRREWAVGMAASALAQFHTSDWSRKQAAKLLEEWLAKAATP